MPPVFWAYAASAAHIAHTSQPAAASTRSSRFIPVPPVRGRGPIAPAAASCRPFYWALMRDDGAADATTIQRDRRRQRRLLVEPDVLHAIAVEDAVDHDRQPFDIGLPARPAPGIKDDWPGAVFGQLLFDRP